MAYLAAGNGRTRKRHGVCPIYQRCKSASPRARGRNSAAGGRVRAPLHATSHIVRVGVANLGGEAMTRVKMSAAALLLTMAPTLPASAMPKKPESAPLADRLAIQDVLSAYSQSVA